ncbi:MAG: UDP-3-O-(3-hydroxymyristoyl)glucosamine N-acyltransferase [Gammaproteobacteria bacterium]|jgi:acetyltransferase-like isoleucine patch superfamily enzyme
MKLDKAYTISELGNVLGAECISNDNKLFDTISTITNPIKGSLGFLTSHNDYDLTLFAGLIVDISFSREISKDILLFRTKNVSKSLSKLLYRIDNGSEYESLKNHLNVTIGENVTIGSNCLIYPGVFINHNTIIGDNVIIHPNAVIGSDGFGLYRDENSWVKIPHVGSVVIENNVEIGSGTTIDRGMIDNTHLRKNCKIDNLVHIAHNVTIGENTAIAACTGIAGSTIIGNNCTIGGGVGINGHITVCDNVHIHGMTMVTKSIKKEGSYASAMAADTVRNWSKNQVLFRNLYKKK